MAEVAPWLKATGRAFGAAAGWVSDRAVGAYRALDPDLRRHLGQTPLLAISLVTPRRAPVRRQVDDGHPPLVLVHGLGAVRGCFLPMSTYLRIWGRRRIFAADFGAAAGIDARARRLAGYVRRVQRATGAPKVDIVAHSLGGIIARLAITEHGLEDAVATLVTLGTPHLGTHAARYAGNPLGRALRPGSSLMLRLASSPLPPHVRAVSLWSRSDVFVLPASSAALEGTIHVEATPLTHYGYLVTPEGWALVKRALDGRAPRRGRAKRARRAGRGNRPS